MLEAKFLLLEERMGDLQSAQKGYDVALALSSRAQNLRAVLDSVRPLFRSIDLLREHGISVPAISGSGYLRSQAADVLEAHRANPRAQESYTLKALERAAKGWVEPAHEEILKAWQGHIDQTVPQVTEQILAIFSPVQSLREPVTRIREAQAQVQALRQKLPQTRGFQELVRLAGVIKEAYGQIDTDDLSDEVRAFLKAFGSGGAVLSLLTPGVLAWIERHGLVEEFRVVPRAR